MRRVRFSISLSLGRTIALGCRLSRPLRVELGVRVAGRGIPMTVVVRVRVRRFLNVFQESNPVKGRVTVRVSLAVGVRVGASVMPSKVWRASES